MGFPRATFTDWSDTMAQVSFAEKRTNPRFIFFADAEATLQDGTLVLGQLSELSSLGCYIDTLESIPIGTQIHLRICDGLSSCEVHGRVIYMHSGSGLGIFGMGVLFGEIAVDQHSAIEAWLRELADRRASQAVLNLSS
jgi:hypothetical protein